MSLCRKLKSLRFVMCVLAALPLHGQARASAKAPDSEGPLRMVKVDPPNWYATLPKPMLLVQGEGLRAASFTLSDAALKIEKVAVSENGHWAQLWLAASPAKAETVELRATRGAERAAMPYAFAAPRAASDGMAGFGPADVMYLIMTDRFADGDLNNDGPLARSAVDSPEAAAERAKPRGWHGGDLRGIEQRIDYLKELGVTTVWPTPVYQNHGPEAYHGYHCTDYYAVDEHYGSMADLQSLARHLHAQGMKLVLDTVPNHVGPFHPWVHDPPMPDWFHGTLASHKTATYDFNQLTDPHSTRHNRETVLNGWFVDLLPDMNTENPVVAQYLRQNAAWWIEQTGADGLRIDTFAFVNRQFWADYTAALHALFPRLTEVGEVVTDSTRVASFFAGGHAPEGADGAVDTGLTTLFDFPLYFALNGALAGRQPMTTLADVLRDDALYPHAENLVTLLGNHDNARFLASKGATPASLRMAFGLVGTMRGMPHLYYGDEVAMSGGEDPDNRQDMPGGFVGAGPNAFTQAGRSPVQQETHEWVKKVFALRGTSAALQSGEQQQIFVDKDALAFVRQGKGVGSCRAGGGAERFLVVLNAAKEGRDFSVSAEGTDLEGCGQFAAALASGSGSAEANSAGSVHVHVGPESFVVFRAKR